MSIAKSAASAFDDRTQNRGNEYFANNEIELIQPDNRSFVGVVKGPLGEHITAVDAYDYEGGVLSAHCDCKPFKKGKLCKHLWATLLEIDSRYEVPQKKGLRVIQSDAAAEAVERQANIWKVQFEAIQAETARRVRAPVVKAKQKEAWFVLELEKTQTAGKLHLDLYCRESRASGGWGKVKKLTYSTEMLPGFTNPEDRQLLDLLCGGTKGVPEQNYYRSWWDTRHSRSGVAFVEMSPAMHPFALPKLARTNRFAWVLDDEQPIEDARPLAWSGDEPWRFRLKVNPSEKSTGWDVRGELFRGEETHDIATPVMLSAEGFVLFEDAIGLLDAADAFSWIVALRREGVISVPKKAGDELAGMLLQSPAGLEVDLPEEFGWKEVEEKPRPRLVIVPTKNGNRTRLYGKLSFLYGDSPIELDDPQGTVLKHDEKVVHRRSPAAEEELLSNLTDFGLRMNTDGKSETHVWLPKKQFTKITHQLTESGWSVEADGRRIRRAGAFNLSVASNINWFELEGGCDFEGRQVALPALLSALRKGNKFVVLDDGTQGMLPEDWLDKYGSLAELGKSKGDALRFSHSQAALLDALLAAQENVEVDQDFMAMRDRLRSFDGVKPQKEIDSFQGELREYQREGLGWLNFLREYKFGGCLADDMGLGKTVQVLALLEAERVRADKEKHLPSLAVVPRSLVFNWIEEAEQFTPNLKVANYTGQSREAMFDQIDDHDLIVTTYGTLRRDIVKLREKEFQYAIIDEAQAIKNANSQAAKACRLVNAHSRLAMTGTPVENHLGELWSLFEFLNPGMLGRSTTFARLAKNNTDKQGLQVLASALKPFMLRRTKKQVLTELPDKTEQTLYCEMGAEQRKHYNELRDFYRASLNSEVETHGLAKSKIHVLEALLRLRQAACHPGLLDEKHAGAESAKLDTLVEQLTEIISEGHKALVFSQFTSFLKLVRDRLDPLKIPYEYLDGRTRNRKAKVDAFQNNPDCPLFLISLKAGGHGLNLTAADYVFILDPWWNPAVEAQAIDRAHRIGQSQRVFAYRLICRDTVEDKIIELQKSKRDLADAIVASNNTVISDLTADDLELLLS